MSKARQAQDKDGGGPHGVLFQVFTEIGIIDQLMQTRVEILLAPELNMPQFAVLNHMIRCGDGCALVHLAQAMQVTKAAMTNTITRLAEKGIVSVTPDPRDRRGKNVHITPQGRQAHARALHILADDLAGLGDAVDPAALAAAGQTLTALRTWLDARRQR